MSKIKVIKEVAKKLKNSRAKRDQETIKNSAYLKNTPMSTLTQAKIMKKETASLAKTTSKIAKAKDKSSKLTVDQYNQITNKMGTGKGVGGSTVYKKDKFGIKSEIPSLSTRPIGGTINAPGNLTLGQVRQGEAIANQQRARDYAAYLRQQKRDVNAMRKEFQSPTVKKVKTTSYVLGGASVFGSAAYLKNKNKNK